VTPRDLTDPFGERRMEFQLTLRKRGITDKSVLRAMDAVPREQFVEQGFDETAYSDQALPIACGQTISQPFVVAYMTQALELRPEHHVLEIGTGSGYQAAVLSRIARSVVSLERYRTLAETARARLKRLNYENVEVLLADGLHGDAMRAPYDRIIVTAAAESVPKDLTAQLKEGGVMIVPLGPHTGTQMLVRFRKRGGELVREDLIAVRFVPLLAGQAREL
jgi:protein-L-isoaspartate(D-aspartate) O-methyltransferase